MIAVFFGMNLRMKNKVNNRIFTTPEAYNKGRADCILVLGATVYDNGMLSYMLKDRQEYAGQFRREIREMIAQCKDMIKVAVRLKPQYLGETIPLWNSGDVTNDK